MDGRVVSSQPLAPSAYDSGTSHMYGTPGPPPPDHAERRNAAAADLVSQDLNSYLL